MVFGMITSVLISVIFVLLPLVSFMLNLVAKEELGYIKPYLKFGFGFFLGSALCLNLYLSFLSFDFVVVLSVFLIWLVLYVYYSKLNGENRSKNRNKSENFVESMNKKGSKNENKNEKSSKQGDSKSRSRNLKVYDENRGIKKYGSYEVMTLLVVFLTFPILRDVKVVNGFYFLFQAVLFFWFYLCYAGFNYPLNKKKRVEDLFIIAIVFILKLML